MTSLDGEDWQLQGWLGDEWRWHVDKPWDAPGWLPARVPGSVLDDLARAGEVTDLYRGRNSRLAEWVPERTWVYRRRVEGPGTVRFEGVDHEATVFVGGEEVARHEGAFTPFEVDLPAGDHLLAVAVHAAPENEAQVGRTSKVRVHKSRMGYGWDFCPRIVHQGIWRPVTLDPPPEVFPQVRLEDGVGTVEVGGQVVLRVVTPELWWPNGMGEQTLYQVPELGISVGFRTVDLDDYALVVNGVRAPIKGWNRVPVDALYGVPRPEKVAHLLGLAARAHVNLPRVWGGGLIETPALRALRPARPARLAGVLAVELRDRERPVGRIRFRRADDLGGARDRAAPAATCFARDLVRRQRARRRRLDARARRAARGRGRARSRPVWLPTSPLGERDVHGPWEHQGLREHTKHYDTRTSRLQRVRRRGHDEPAHDRRARALAGRPHEPGVRAPRSLVEQRAARAGTLRRPDRGRRDDAALLAVVAVRGAALRRRGDPAPRRRHDSVAAERAVSERLVHVRDRLSRRPEARLLGRRPRLPSRPSDGALHDLGLERSRRGAGRRDGAGAARRPRRHGVAESDGGAIAAPLDTFAADVFLLDLGPDSRYAMTRTDDLAPLLDLPRTELAFDGGTLRNTGAVAALGVVLEDARPYDDPGWVTFSDNALDLLPGETREIEVAGPVGALRVEGWNARV